MVDWTSEYRQLRGLWRQEPILYAKHRIGLNPTTQQKDLLTALTVPGAKVTVRSGHGTGKSASMACAILWKLECFDYSRIPCTAPSAHQLRNVLWAEAAKWFRNSFQMSKKWGMPRELYLSSLFEMTQSKICARGAPKEWFAIARTAKPTQPDALQGFHASDIVVSEDGRTIVTEDVSEEDSHKGQIMFVVEEAGGVADSIFEVAEGALSSPNASLLMCGNPTRSHGYFADSHKKNRSQYKCLHFKCTDSPLVSNTYRARLVLQFGEGSNMVRVRADGEFPVQDDNTLISLEVCEAAIMRPALKTGRSGNRRLGCDVARYGGDRTVFCLRDGNNVEHIHVVSRIDTMACVGYLVKFAKQWRADSVHIDISGGLGAGPYDRLLEKKRDGTFPKDIQIIGVNVSERAPDRKNLDSEYQPHRLRDYIWLEMKEWLYAGEASFEMIRNMTNNRGDDTVDMAEDLAGELCVVRYTIDSNGHLVVESKDAMKKRKIRSCDLADALGTTFFDAGVIGPGAGIFELARQQAEAIRKAKEGNLGDISETG